MNTNHRRRLLINNPGLRRYDRRKPGNGSSTTGVVLGSVLALAGGTLVLIAAMGWPILPQTFSLVSGLSLIALGVGAAISSVLDIVSHGF